MPVIPGPEALAKLQHDYGFNETRAIRVLDIARECTYKAEPCDGGFVGVRYRGNVAGHPRQRLFEIEDHSGREVAEVTDKRYTQGKNLTSSKRRDTMPARTRTKPVPEPEPVGAEDVGGLDVDRILAKEFTPTQQDFIEWYETNIEKLDALEPDRILITSLLTYGTFQKSEFNRDRKAERRAARTAPADEEQEEVPEQPKPAKRGRPAANKAPAAKAPEGNGQPAPPRRGRGRPAANKALY